MPFVPGRRALLFVSALLRKIRGKGIKCIASGDRSEQRDDVKKKDSPLIAAGEYE